VDDTRGTLELAEVLEVIDAEGDHQVHVAAVTLRTRTCSRGAPLGTSEDCASLRFGYRPSVNCNLDGARLFNAVVATGTSAASTPKRPDGDDVSVQRTLCSRWGSLLAGPAVV